MTNTHPHLELQQTHLFGESFSVIVLNNKPYFFAKEIARVLETSTQSMLEGIEKGEKMYKALSSESKERTWILSENGLYEAIMQSKIKRARLFKRCIKKLLREYLPEETIQELRDEIIKWQLRTGEVALEKGDYELFLSKMGLSYDFSIFQQKQKEKRRYRSRNKHIKGVDHIDLNIKSSLN